jgi:glycosyltransferase involved in cell wall biosynthesis
MERVVEMLAVGQAEHSHAVRVAAVVTPDSAAKVERYLLALGAGGIPVHRVEVAGRGYARESAMVADLVREFRPDVVHSHGYRTDVVDGPRVRRQGTPFVVTAHGYTGGGFRNHVYEWIQRRSLKRCDAVVAVSRPLQQELARAGIARDRLHLVVNGWKAPASTATPAEARRALGTREGTFAIGWVGRVSHEKGLEVAIRALTELRDVPVALVVVGDGPRRAEMVALAAQLGVSTRVHWVGVVSGAARLFTGFDALVCSSHTEGTPIVLLEAMSAGVPIVSTRVGGIPDILTDDEAVLVSAGDASAIAAAIRAIIRDPAVGESRAAAARARLERDRGADHWVAEYDHVYEAAMRIAEARR